MALALSSSLTWRRQCAMAGCFLVVITLVRAPTLFRSVLDWDESLYLLMAEQWRAGHLPYTTIWDNKPIGIYVIFLIFIDIFGRNVAAIRLASDIFITANAFIIFKITYLLLTTRTAPQPLGLAIFAGVSYGIGSLSNDGLSANTEIFMTCFTALAMLLAIAPMPAGSGSLRRSALCGVVFGLAVMTKYVAILEAPALALALLSFNPPSSRTGYVWRLLACAAGGVIPLLITVSVYGEAGLLSLWWQDSVASNMTRVGAAVPVPAIGYFAGYQLKNWAPFYAAILLLAGLWAMRPQAVLPDRRAIIFAYAWLFCGALGVAAAKSFYDHYFLQILPALCLIAALTMASSGLTMRRALVIFMVIPVIAGWHALADAARPVFKFQNGHFSITPDTPDRVAQDLEAALQPGQQVYVFDDQPVIYSLIQQDPPTRYVLPSDLTTCFLPEVAGVNEYDEIYRILAMHPEFIIRTLYPASAPSNRNYAVYQLMDRALDADYQPWKSEGASEILLLLNTKPISFSTGDDNIQSCGHQG
jgi:4-amino-4-deoxy-L-arabinose transferase-like glycosyltransferase